MAAQRKHAFYRALPAQLALAMNQAEPPADPAEAITAAQVEALLRALKNIMQRALQNQTDVEFLNCQLWWKEPKKKEAYLQHKNCFSNVTRYNRRRPLLQTCVQAVWQELYEGEIPKCRIVACGDSSCPLRSSCLSEF